MEALMNDIRENTRIRVRKPSDLSHGDRPGAQLGSVQVDGSGFAWSRQLRRALGTKMKLGFLTGDVARPDPASKDIPCWIRCDELVSCWILNSMLPDLANSFILANSAADLWIKVSDRYSHGNAPILYQLKQELMRIVQGGLPVTAYYSKLKRCLDELQCQNATCGKLASCECKVLELENQDRLLHFLVNLNAEYDLVKSQILAMDHLPTLNKAYFLILQVEKQKSTGISVPDPVAFTARGSSSTPRDARFSKGNRDKKHCTHCDQDGHMAENWVFDPGGFKTTELELVVLGALHLFDEMPCISVLVCEMRRGVELLGFAAAGFSVGFIPTDHGEEDELFEFKTDEEQAIAGLDRGIMEMKKIDG